MKNLQGENVVEDRNGNVYLLKSELVWEKMSELPEDFEHYNLTLTNWISAHGERKGKAYKLWWYEEDAFRESSELEEYEADYVEELK